MRSELNRTVKHDTRVFCIARFSRIYIKYECKNLSNLLLTAFFSFGCGLVHDIIIFIIIMLSINDQFTDHNMCTRDGLPKTLRSINIFFDHITG